MPLHFVVVNDSAAPPHVGLRQIRTRATDFGPRTVQFEIDRLAQGLPRQLTATELDFVEVLAALFAIDISCARGDAEDWAREIHAWIPVRDPDRWNALADRLARCFGAFTLDRIQLSFVLDAAPADPPRQGVTPHPAGDCVALLSGGVDSFVGAAELLSSGSVPLYLSHKNSGAASTALAAVVPVLEAFGGPADTISFTARRTQEDTLAGESSQRARSMIYMGLAAVLATAHGLERVWINENGVMAVHVPLTEARAGSFSTRTASPRAVAQWAEFCATALDATVTIDNLLVGRTKPEVARLGVDLGVGPYLPQTVSCWSIGRTHVHCGRCTPCLIRQISHEWAGVDDNEYDAHPFDELPTGPAEAVARDNVSHLLQLAIDLDEQPDDILMLDYPELCNVVPPQTRQTSLDMHRRWSRQALEVAERHAYARSQL